MECPNCGGACYDNREKIAGGWKGPVYKCKDQECGWKQWPPKGQSNGQRGNNGANAPAPSRAPLGPVYAECFDFAKKAVTHYLGDMATADAIVAATATLFIQAMQSGRPIKVAKPAPPAPKPEPEYVPEFGGSDLPF
jgi:hypothetical protein